MKKCFIFFLSFFVHQALFSITKKVPAEYTSIQKGIDAAADGDTVMVAPGEYHENLVINKKKIALVSHFLKLRNPDQIQQTIIDGDGETVIEIQEGADETTILGFTIQNGDDGIFTEAKFNLLHNRILKCSDGIDYEKYSGGLCRYNIFENNHDDAIDLDDYPDIIIKDNILKNNEDDGIEIRLHEYSGPQITCIIRRNLISGNGEDGIQFIDYPDTSNRVFFVENNIITKTTMAAIGCMSDGNTKENYEAANIPERINVVNNTLIDNCYGITGGDNMIVLNNIIMNTQKIALKNVDEKSIVAYNMLWQNVEDIIDCKTDQNTNLFVDPLLDQNYRLRTNSPAIDKGVTRYELHGELFLDKQSNSYSGSSPDIGAYEYGSSNWLQDVLHDE